MGEIVLYRGAYTGIQVDAAVGRALAGGEIDKEISSLKSAVGSPLLATTVADMTDTSRIYVYAGSEAGYVNGNWYYWNGTAWVSGGAYLAGGYVFDAVPTEGSTNPVESNGIYNAVTPVRDYALGAFATDDASGALVSVPDGADGIPVKSMTVQITPVQAGSGDPSPSNVRPITGWMDTNVYITGINQWNEEWETGNYDTSTGDPSPQGYVTNQMRSKADSPIPVRGGETYCAYNGYSGSRVSQFLWYDETDTFISATGNSSQNPVVVTAPANAKHLRFQTPVAYGATYRGEISINYPSTETAYHIGSNNSTILVTWQNEAGTIYSGTATYLGNGRWRVVKIMSGVDLGDCEWSYEATYFRSGSINDAIRRPATNTEDPNAICSCFKVVSWNTASANGLLWIAPSAQGNVKVISIKDTRYTDAATFKAAMAGQMLVYELATPEIYDIDAPDPETVLGDNNIWADAGDVDVTYRVDTALFIRKLIGE